MRYLLLQADNSVVLEIKVNEALNQGWRPCGGVSVCPIDMENDLLLRYSQAMTLAEAGDTV